ncbi:hypothetical protein HanXRQr2_Chr04g0172341 [Helianthus annuus]|uniref:Uncharacterized protein n=1 Tax=Helianthus annuus TaxID=4232 RepID=A0A9K3J8C2_HELAN|nr:hypothetical protein HanXRQr2_Chr04g0172341 [Helianthus annuus]KAJ0931788.1 hypothetical protein HanPSC8_Chr04g0165991 [Helianthus annuus]
MVALGSFLRLVNLKMDMTLAEIIVYCLLPFHFLMIRYQDPGTFC